MIDNQGLLSVTGALLVPGLPPVLSDFYFIVCDFLRRLNRFKVAHASFRIAGLRLPFFSALLFYCFSHFCKCLRPTEAKGDADLELMD